MIEFTLRFNSAKRIDVELFAQQMEGLGWKFKMCLVGGLAMIAPTDDVLTGLKQISDIGYDLNTDFDSIEVAQAA
jgi:hypothetical protein